MANLEIPGLRGASLTAPAAPVAPVAPPVQSPVAQTSNGNLPTRNSNPGDLRGSNGQFQQFSDPLQGKAALYNDLTAKMTGHSTTGLGPNSTLIQFSKVYDPKGDGQNNPLQYAADLANQLGVSPDTTIGSLMPRIDDFAAAVAHNEGYKGEWSGSGNSPAQSSGTNGGPGIGSLPGAAIPQTSAATDNTPAPQSSQQDQPGINNGKGIGGFLTKLIKPELTAVATGARAIQSVPSTIKGLTQIDWSQAAKNPGAFIKQGFTPAGPNDPMYQAQQTAVKPLLGVNPALGNSISQNLGLALQTAGQAEGFGAGALATQTAGSDINSGTSIPQTILDTALTYGGAKGLELLSPYLAPLLAKGGSAAFEALPQAVQDLITTVAKSGTELKGAIGDALKPIFEKIGTPSFPGTNAISELSNKIPSAIKDYFGGEGTTQALMVKKATPGLVDAWQTGDRTAADVGDSLNSDFNAYKTQGIQKLQAVKNSLPDVAMPQSNIKGGINKIIEDETSNANTSEGDERTLKNLQNFLDRNLGNDTTSKGALDLRTALDNGDYYVGDGQHNVSDAVVKKIRQYLNDTAIERMANYDTEYGTQYAPQLKKALADSSDSIKFQDKFKRNILGNNPNTYVEQTTNKVKKLINKSADPTEMENTKELLTEFENRIGQSGKYAKDFQAANAAKTLKGMGGRVLKKAGSLGLKAAIGGGLYEAGTNGLIGKLLKDS